MTSVASWTDPICLVQMYGVQKGSCKLMSTTAMADAVFVSKAYSLLVVKHSCIPVHMMCAVPLAASAPPLGSGATSHPQMGPAAHTHRPMCPSRRPSSAPAPLPRKRQPAVRFCAACLAALLLSARAWQLASGCRGSGRPVLASRRRTSFAQPYRAMTARRVPEEATCACPPTPLVPLSGALFSPCTPRVSA